MDESPEAGAGNDETRTLASFVDDAKALDDRAFAERHGRQFLLHHGGIGSLKPAQLGQNTLLCDGSRASSMRPQLDFLVFRIRPTGRSHLPGLVSIGRTSSNDIVINDESISSFHAFFRVDDDGTAAIKDCGSVNGTYVNEASIADLDTREPTVLASGDTVRLGRVRLSFLTASAFRMLVLGLAG